MKGGADGRGAGLGGCGQERHQGGGVDLQQVVRVGGVPFPVGGTGVGRDSGNGVGRHYDSKWLSTRA